MTLRVKKTVKDEFYAEALARGYSNREAKFFEKVYEEWVATQAPRSQTKPGEPPAAAGGLGQVVSEGPLSPQRSSQKRGQNRPAQK